MGGAEYCISLSYTIEDLHNNQSPFEVSFKSLLLVIGSTKNRLCASIINRVTSKSGGGGEVRKDLMGKFYEGGLKL